MTENLLLAFGLTLMAGLATGIGSLLAFLTTTTNTKFFIIHTWIFCRGDDLRIDD